MPFDPSEVSRIRHVSQRWADALAVGDLELLRQLMTEDVVVIYGNGQRLHGRDAVMAHLAQSLAEYRIRQRVEPEETVVAHDWAFERSRVHTTMTARHGGGSLEFHSLTLTILRNEGGPWCVARTMGVFEPA
jgi:uncharacterized protein (TIGR02246 family)